MTDYDDSHSPFTVDPVEAPNSVPRGEILHEPKPSKQKDRDYRREPQHWRMTSQLWPERNKLTNANGILEASSMDETLTQLNKTKESYVPQWSKIANQVGPWQFAKTDFFQP